MFILPDKFNYCLNDNKFFILKLFANAFELVIYICEFVLENITQTHSHTWQISLTLNMTNNLIQNFE